MTFIGKYLQLAKLSWESGFVYRLNFIMWRVRNVIQLLCIYFLWSAISANQATIFSYQQSALITYVLGTSLIRAVVFSSRSIDAQGEIATGDLSNYLIKPVNYFFYWGARDISDKLLNTIFSVVEILVLYFLLKPQLVIQTKGVQLLLFFIAVCMATVLYFIVSFIISMTTFWYYEFNGWAQRFLSFMLLESLAGGLFPLDLIQGKIGTFITNLPTAYFLYFPMQVFLDRLSLEKILSGFMVMVMWILALYLVAYILWRKGLKIYGAFGR